MRDSNALDRYIGPNHLLLQVVFYFASAFQWNISVKGNKDSQLNEETPFFYVSRQRSAIKEVNNLARSM